jgi:hypothetical protein
LDEGGRAVLLAIAERLIPADEHGPGAGEANVVEYIERALAGDYRAHEPAYAAGLALVGERAVEHHGRRFDELGPEQQDAVLTSLEAEESPFFELVLRHVKEGMFGDPAWGGNAGYAGWRLLGYAGPRHVWTEEEQRLDATVEPSYESHA